MNRDYVFPEEANRPDFQFGAKTVASDNTVKDLM
jgi:hypothetical protein